MVLAHRTPFQEKSVLKHPKTSREVIYLDHQATNLKIGDHERNYAGASTPKPKILTVEEGTRENETPEQALISKERWAIVRQVVLSNPKVSPYLEWLLDHFAGYSYAEIAERHQVTRQVAFHKITETIDYLQKRIKGHQF